MEIIGFIMFFVILFCMFGGGNNKDSTSYKLGKGVGSKVGKFGKWLMDE